jgi:hypothetical protein
MPLAVDAFFAFFRDNAAWLFGGGGLSALLAEALQRTRRARPQILGALSISFSFAPQ